MEINICGRREVLDRITAFGPDAVVSIMDPAERESMDRLLEGRAPYAHRFAFRDLAPPIISKDMPNQSHLSQLFREMPLYWKGRETRYLFHCHEGISRSTAMAVAALAFEHSRLLGEKIDMDAAERIADQLSNAQSLAMPNLQIPIVAEALLPEWAGMLSGAVLERVREKQGAELILLPSGF